MKLLRLDQNQSKFKLFKVNILNLLSKFVKFLYFFGKKVKSKVKMSQNDVNLGQNVGFMGQTKSIFIKILVVQGQYL